jgi:hypothetical protein
LIIAEKERFSARRSLRRGRQRSDVAAQQKIASQKITTMDQTSCPESGAAALIFNKYDIVTDTNSVVN